MPNIKPNHRKLKLLENLEPIQKEAINKILDKLDSNEKLSKKDLDQFINYEKISCADVCKLLQITRSSLQLMIAQNPIMKNNDGSYNLIRVIDFIRTGADDENEKQATLAEKYWYQIQKLKKDISDDEDEREKEIDNKISACAGALNTFLTQSCKMNIHQFEYKSIDELRILFDQYHKQMIEAFINGKVVNSDE